MFRSGSGLGKVGLWLGVEAGHCAWVPGAALGIHAGLRRRVLILLKSQLPHLRDCCGLYLHSLSSSGVGDPRRHSGYATAPRWTARCSEASQVSEQQATKAGATLHPQRRAPAVALGWGRAYLPLALTPSVTGADWTGRPEELKIRQPAARLDSPCRPLSPRQPPTARFGRKGVTPLPWHPLPSHSEASHPDAAPATSRSSARRPHVRAGLTTHCPPPRPDGQEEEAATKADVSPGEASSLQNWASPGPPQTEADGGQKGLSGTRGMMRAEWDAHGLGQAVLHNPTKCPDTLVIEGETEAPGWEATYRITDPASGQVRSETQHTAGSVWAPMLLDPWVPAPQCSGAGQHMPAPGGPQGGDPSKGTAMPDHKPFRVTETLL